MSNNLLKKELNSQNGLESVKEIQFSIFSQDLINRGAVTEILTSDTYNGAVPAPGGLLDMKMGSIDKYRICSIDERDSETCPGYFGKISFPKPVFNFHFLPYIEKILKMVCFRCGNLLIDKSDPIVLKELEELKGYKRFEMIYNIIKKVKKKECIYNNGCRVLQPVKYQRLSIDKIQDRDWIIKINAEFSQNAFKDESIAKDQTFTPQMCADIFSKISNEDVEFLGMPGGGKNRPESMIIKHMAVPPPAVRPSIRQDNNQRSEDDLTFSLSHITKQVKTLRDEITNRSDKKKVSIHHGMLQYYVATYMDNEIPGVNPLNQRTSQRALKGLRQRLKSKEGRMRGNIQGKRVDYSGRTVISVDPNITINEWGVPRKIAMNLTYPEIVTKFNINQMYQLIRNGPRVYPGAKFIKKVFTDDLGNVNEKTFSLHRLNLDKVILEIGDVVHRHLQDGDICLFNRQPSLHRMSMMAHKIRVMDYKTFRLNITICNPYNADFDGDEMNMHVPQSIACTEELKRIALVQNNIISPGNSKPITPIVQDCIIGAYLMTKEEFHFTKDMIQNLMMFYNNFDNKLPEPKGVDEYGREYWDGNQVFSLILPKITIKTRSIEVKKGTIVDGYLKNDSLESGTDGFIQQIYSAYGTDECADFLNNTQDLITRFMVHNSFSIGYGDCIPDSNVNKENLDLVKSGIEKANNEIRKAQEGVFHPGMDKNLMEQKLDAEIRKLTGESTNLVLKNLMGNMNEDNNFIRAVYSGSKGKEVNIQQIMGVVGQQDIWGSRIPNNLTDRTLPHFPRHDVGPRAKGFIEHSFFEGMDPDETYFNAFSGRMGVIDTAIKTADSGYISRKFIKATEDIVTEYDGTVRNGGEMVLQFSYGHDKYDPVKVEKVPIKLIEYNNEDMVNYYQHDIEDKNYWLGFMTEEAVNNMMGSEGYKEKLEEEYKFIMDGREQLRNKFCKECDFVAKAKTFVPINLFRLIPIVKEDLNIKTYSLSDMSPMYVIEKVKEFYDEISRFSKENDPLVVHKITYSSFLNSKSILKKHRLNKVAFDFMMEKMKNKIYKSYVAPGEAVGVVASQTCGEISTQLTLNTFHLAGVGAKIIVAGVPRLREVIGLTKSDKMKKKTMEIFLKEEYNTDKEEVEIIANKLKYTKLSDIIVKSEIMYESDQSVSETEQEEFVAIYDEFSDLFDLGNSNGDCMSNWVVRLVFNRDMLMVSNINVSRIQELIYEKTGDDTKCVFSDDNASEVLMKISIAEGNINAIREVEKDLMNMTITGIIGINEANPGKANVIRYLDDGSYSHVKENVVYVDDGSNLAEVLGNSKVDTKRTVSNDINEVYNLFGIEAARSLIMSELNVILEGENKLNPKHLQIMGDLMTYKGYLIQIDRFGVNKKEDLGPITKASFEETMNIFVKAAVFGEKDNMKGPSANVMMGQFCKSGTNAFDLLIDTDKIINSDVVQTEEFTEINKDELDTTDMDTFLENDFRGNKEVTADDFSFGIDLPGMTGERMDNMGLDEIDIEITKNNNVVSNIRIENKLENVNIDEDTDEESEEEDVFDDDEFDELESEEEEEVEDDSDEEEEVEDDSDEEEVKDESDEEEEVEDDSDEEEVESDEEEEVEDDSDEEEVESDEEDDSESE